MDILILGGTVFLGRAIVEEALSHGHKVTLFNRGKSNPDLFPGVENLIGDRDNDISALEGRRWDLAIDTCGYVPRIVGQSARLLSNAINHYTFISSVSVYADFSKPDIDENSPVGTIEDETVEEITGETYGPLKALCEQEILQNLPNRSLVIRPGLIVGPHDTSDRFTYWVLRVSEGGEVLVPNPADLPVEFIDVRDLAKWTLNMSEKRATGTFNAIGPGQPLGMEQFLDTCKVISEIDASFSWVEGEFLLNNEVAPWTEMPMWIPIDQPEFAGFFAVSGERALEAGLNYRPIVDTIQDTLVWAKSRPEKYEMKAGISREREMQLLKLWKDKHSECVIP
jgi:2'-hydroxyisoflavone reductase